MRTQEKDAGKLTLSEWQAQEWRASQPSGKWFMGTLLGGTLLHILYRGLNLPPAVYFGLALLLCFAHLYSGAKLAKIRRQRDAQQKQAMEHRWREEDEQLLRQRSKQNS
jgi:hypothetical protein